ncbi:MAG: T9SS type A sorting domain-containing protein [Sphingobacteriales bacterium]|nr:MAG: T9SS type A sorting domain-containing protein [Sphingobacteriales bacterium]
MFVYTQLTAVKNLLLIAFLTLAFLRSWSQDLSFYVYAHPDDWQLFMGTNAFDDIAAGYTKKVVMIQLSAAEQGNGTNLQTYYNGRSYLPFYLARLSGSEKSVQFASDTRSAHGQWKSNMEVVNGHNILKKVYKNVVMYTLFLSDDGSLSQMYHDNKGIGAIDGSATYTSREDLVKTIGQIFSFESIGYAAHRRNLYITDPDACQNPGENSDHKVAALIAATANTTHGMHMQAYETYCTKDKPVNLTGEEIAKKAALFALADLGRTENNIWSTFVVHDREDHHINWLSRQYVRDFGENEFFYATQNVPCNERSPQKPTKDDRVITAPTTRHVYLSPNPLTIHFDLTYEVVVEGQVRIDVLDSSGRPMGTVLNERQPAGMHSLRYNTLSLIAGQYILMLQTATYNEVVKFIKN